MVTNKFNMIDLDGLDIIESQGAVVTGLYDKLVESIALCRYQCIYNWKFNSIHIPPTYVELAIKSDGVWINDGVVVSPENIIHIYSIEPGPIPPTVEPVENASVFKWLFNSATTCWGIMKKLTGDVIGQNGDNANVNIPLIGDLMTVTLHGNSQVVEVVANVAIELKAYTTGRSLGAATMTEYTMEEGAQHNFTMDDLYGGYYFEAETI